mmetsp:Transcript_49979/g.79081  ORF Transcript_49979/g.79081 Transcript_49979/m.79081 type:complete len:203 (-) Transcript_49979:69-677(-)|eukprot:CAMPEP_0169117234 /NCGR_PEP_ID=MMETSP1015-20121227/30346_1 /TAXON_ID=342587 /ORGANISM="Karlodinium micrum, Strain CCMP2283" /LENGTH=202 /DNA_ID=CAMNT_0009179897 /DNA_START=52 /DNA_END=660 /DNA_ORIENTATION=-
MAQEHPALVTPGLLEALQGRDPQITSIIAYSKFVVAYLLQQDGPSPGWRKANIEGPVYLVAKRDESRQLLVQNQFSTNDLAETLHPEWELDCQKNYIFFKVEDPSKRIRGLWFHDDQERQKMESILEQTLTDIRNPRKPKAEAQVPDYMLGKGSANVAPEVGSAGSVVVTKESLRNTFHALADDPKFLDAVMKKLTEGQRRQ